MKYSITLIILLALITLVFNQNCQSNPSTQKLQTGTHTFQLNPFNSRTNCFNTSLNNVFSSASTQLTTGLLQIGQFQTSNQGIEFSLRAYLTNNNAQASFTLIVNNGSWSSVQISYLATARNDFYVGTHLSDANQLASCHRQSPFNLNIVVPSTANVPQSQSLAVLVFLNGLITPSNSLAFQFAQPIYDANLKQINLTVVSTATQQIQVIFLSYILVDLAQLSTAGYTYSFSLTQAHHQYLVAGIVSLNTTSSPAVQHAFFGLNSANSLTCVGFTCSQCISSSTCQTQGGQVMGNLCVRCSGGQSYVSGVGCACNTGLYLINGNCGTCPSTSTYNSTSQTCITNCGANSILSGNICVCQAGFYNISGTCQTCPTGTTYNSTTMTCQNICGSNSYSLGNVCVCHLGFYNISGNCQSCPGGTTYNSSSQSCVSSCGSNSMHNGATCVCNTGYFNISGTCQMCPSGTTYNANAQNCQIIVSCGPNSIASGSSCFCSNGYFNISGSCQTCPAGTTYNSNTQTCINICGNNQIWSNNACQCIQGYTLLNNICIQTTTTCGNNMVLLNGVCRCLSHLLQYQGNCYQCPANSAVTADQTGCVCNAGHILSSSYACVPANVNSAQGSTGSTSSSSGSSTTSTTSSTSSSTSTNSGTSNTNSGSSSGSTSSGSSGSSSSSNSGSSSTTTQTGTSTSSTTNTTTNTGSSSGSTGNIYGGSTTIVNNSGSSSSSSSSTSSSSSSSSGSSSISGSTTITTNETVMIHSTIYVHVLVSHLPSSLANNNCPNCSTIVTASLLNNPSNANVSVNFIPNTTHHWVAAITYQVTPFSVTLNLRFNQTYSSHFTPTELSSQVSLPLNPSTVPIYHVSGNPSTSGTTNSLQVQQDILGESSKTPQSSLDQAIEYFQTSN